MRGPTMRYKGSASVSKVPMLSLSPPHSNISLKNVYVFKCVMNIYPFISTGFNTAHFLAERG